MRGVPEEVEIIPRTAPLNQKLQWREWSGYFASSAYADAHDIEYNAIREAAALIDVSPLYKYLVGGPDARRLVDRVITRDATKLMPGRVFYTPWCDEHGKVIDDGTVHGLDDGTIAAVSASSGRLRWRTRSALGAIGPFTPDGELLLVPAEGTRGGMLAFRHDPSGRLLDVPLPTTAATNEWLTATRAMKLGDEDFAAVFQALGRVAGGQA